MINKLKFLIKFSLNRKLNTKWFKIINVILAILIVGVINIDSIIKLFGGDFNEKLNIYVYDEVNSFSIFSSQIASLDKAIYGDDSNDFNIYLLEDNIDNLIKDDNNVIVKINNDEDNIFNAEIISKSKIDSVYYQVITTALVNTKTSLAINYLNLSEDELNKLYTSPSIVRTIYDEEKDVSESQELIMTTVFPIVILPFFMLTIFLIQMIGAEINDEKTTRGMEIIISNVSPKVHFFSKVIAGNVFVILQAILIFLYSVIGIIIRKNIGTSGITSGVTSEVLSMLNTIKNSSLYDKLGYIIPLTIVIMLLTFLAYSLLAGVLASITTNQEDFQQMQTPMIVVLLLGYYLAIMAGVFKGSIFIKFVAVLPFISAILLPSLLVMNQIGILEILIALFLLILAIYLLIKYGLRIYKVGILNYSSSKLVKKMFKAVKENK